MKCLVITLLRVATATPTFPATSNLIVILQSKTRREEFITNPYKEEFKMQQKSRYYDRENFNVYFWKFGKKIRKALKDS